jgi:CHAD domain-containing protein
MDFRFLMGIVQERGKLTFRRTERDLVRLADSHEPEIVHAFRTTTRRLQILLEQLLAGPDRNDKKLLKQLNRIRKRAGRVRDLDAQLAALRSLKIPLEPRRKTRLTHRLIELRAKHEAKLGNLLKKDEVREIRKRLKRALKNADFGTEIDPLSIARELIASVDSAGRMDEDVLHRYRVAVKRSRYAAEFASKSSESEQFMMQLRKLQDALGNWHDWQILTDAAVRELGDINESPLVAALHNVTRAKFRHAIAEIAANAQLIGAKAVSGPLHRTRPTETFRPVPRTETAA